MKHVAIVAYWQWEFNAAMNEYMENNPGEEEVNFYKISSESDIPRGVKLDYIEIGSCVEDIMSHRELEYLLELLERRK